MIGYVTTETRNGLATRVVLVRDNHGAVRITEATVSAPDNCVTLDDLAAVLRTAIGVPGGYFTPTGNGGYPE